MLKHLLKTLCVGFFTLVLMVLNIGTVSAKPYPTLPCHDTEIQSRASGLFVSAEFADTGSQYAMLRARASTVGPFERFSVCAYNEGTSNEYETIRSQANGLYVSTELSYVGSQQFMLRARATSVGPWEKYYIPLVYNTPGDAIVFSSLASTGYVSTEMNYSGNQQYMLRARAGSIGDWEAYYLYSGL